MISDKNDERLASEDWKCLFLITLTMLVIVSGLLINIELNRPINCTPDICYDDFCIILKEGK